MVFYKYLFNKEKIKYVKGKKQNAECILCAIGNRSPDVTVLEVFRTGKFIISANLYPFNPGHLMLFPIRHIEDLSELSSAEAVEMHQLTVRAVSILKEEYSPSGFNIGSNLGHGSGASIAHIHQHIIPRYENEIGFIDVLSGTRLFVVDPVEVMEKLKKRFSEG